MDAPHRPRTRHGTALLGGGGELHVVGRDRVVTLADPDGAVRRLVELADGSRGTDQLHALLAREYPGLRRADVAAAVAELLAAGVLVEDAAARGVLAGRG